jgi:hypothetical protein
MSCTTDYEHGGQRYHVTVGFFPDGMPGELFVNSSQKSGSESDINAADAAVAVSLALQFGCPLQTLADAMRRNADGSAMGPIGRALDLAVAL